MRHEKKQYVIGIDGGGTKTEVALADLSGRIIKIAKVGSTSSRNVGIKKSVENIVEAIKRVKGSKKISLVFIGMPAVEEEYKSKKEIIKKEILKRFKNFKGKLIIESDQLVAFRSGTQERDGVVIISGTGCVCHGWREKKEAKVSGWGWLADEGSGFWAGQRGLQSVLKDLDGRGLRTLITGLLFTEFGLKNRNELLNRIYADYSTRQISLISEIVDKAANRGDKIARSIIEEAGKELALNAKVVVKKLDFKDTIFPIVLVGGMFNSGIALGILKNEVRKMAPGARFLKPKGDPVTGAITLAIENLK